MKRLLFLLLIPVALWGQQYKLLGVKDTTGFPPTAEQGRVVFIDGVAWQNLTGGWIQFPNLWSYFDKDSVGSPGGPGGGDMYRADSTTHYVTRTQFAADTTYKAAQLLTRTTNTAFVADTTYRAAQDVAIRAVQAADSTYKTAQIALKKSDSDTTAATGYVSQSTFKDSTGDHQTQFSTAINSKAATGHTHSTYVPYTDTTASVAMQWELDGKAATVHTHTQANVTGLPDSIAAKPTRTELTTQLGLKQNTISNLADTSKYAEMADSSIGTGYIRNWQLWDKGGSYLELTKGTRKFFAKTDSSSAGGEANTASNLAGSGIGLWKDKSGVDLRFKRLKAGTNVTIVDNTDSVTISATGGGGATKYTATTADTVGAHINRGMFRIGGVEFNVLANKRYKVSGMVEYGNVAATTTGFAFGFTAPAATVAAINVGIPLAVDGVGGEWQGWLNGAADSTVATATPVVSVYFTATFSGYIHTGANAGAVKFTWRPEAAANETLRTAHVYVEQEN